MQQISVSELDIYYNKRGKHADFQTNNTPMYEKSPIWCYQVLQTQYASKRSREHNVRKSGKGNEGSDRWKHDDHNEQSQSFLFYSLSPRSGEVSSTEYSQGPTRTFLFYTLFLYTFLFYTLFFYPLSPDIPKILLEIWKVASIVLIYVWKSPEFPSSRRARCMLNMVGNLYERLIMEKIEQKRGGKAELSKRQFEFGRSCQSKLLKRVSVQ